MVQWRAFLVAFLSSSCPLFAPPEARSNRPEGAGFGTPFVPTPSEHRHAEKRSRGRGINGGDPRPALTRACSACLSISRRVRGGGRLCRESPLMASSMAIGSLCRGETLRNGKKCAEGAPHEVARSRAPYRGDQKAKLRRSLGKKGNVASGKSENGDGGGSMPRPIGHRGSCKPHPAAHWKRYLAWASYLNEYLLMMETAF